MRAFLGIPLPEHVLDALDDVCAFLRDNDTRWRDAKWVPRCNLHVTVAFLGDVAREDADILAEQLAASYAEFEVPQLIFDDVRAVPSLRSARMIWATFEDLAGRCAQLAEESFQAAAKIGVPPPDKSFSAHATLVRSRGRSPLDAAICREALQRGIEVLHSRDHTMSDPSDIFDVRSVIMFESRLTNTGPLYSKVHEMVIGS